MHRLKAIGIILVFCALTAHGQASASDPDSFENAENHIRQLFNRISSEINYKNKIIITDSIVEIFSQILKLPESFDYPFDSLTNVGKITSDDGKLRIITWNLPAADRTNTYYGFLHYKTSGTIPRCVKLTDNSEQLSLAENLQLRPENWYGCLVYDIIDVKYNGKIYYTILGYDPENMFTTKKLIDVLYFNELNEPEFGSPIFSYKGKMLKRIIFTYSAQVQMSMVWNAAAKMIVFDHLSPSQPSFNGNFQYYGPDFSFDGLKFSNGVWELAEDIDVRNSY